MNNREQFEAFLVSEYEWANDTLNAAQFHGDDETGYYTGGDYIYDGQSCSEGLFWAWRGWQAASKASKQQLSESRREFTAANATIHNLELKVAQVAAENAGLKGVVSEINNELYGQGFQVSGWHPNGALEPLDNWFTDNGWGEPETPATDADLAEVRAQVAEEALKIMGNFTSDECGDGVYIAIKEFAAQLRQGAENE